MRNFLDPQKIGANVKRLRGTRQISQEQLAKVLDLPRSSISQIENGARVLSLIEHQKILNFFEISHDEFIALGDQNVSESNKKEYKINRNIKFDEAKFKQLLLYILEKCGSRPNVGETVLYKLLYFCDFDFFETYEKPLTGMKYKKMQFGPVPAQSLFNPVIACMRKEGLIEKVTRQYIGDTIQTKYVNFISADLSIFGPDSEKMRHIVDTAIGKLSHMTARQIEEYSHKDYPWKSHMFNEEIDYYSVFQRDGEFSTRDYEQEFIQTAAGDVHADLPPLEKEEFDYYMSLPD